MIVGQGLRASVVWSVETEIENCWFRVETIRFARLPDRAICLPFLIEEVCIVIIRVAEQSKPHKVSKTEIFYVCCQLLGCQWCASCACSETVFEFGPGDVIPQAAVGA